MLTSNLKAYSKITFFENKRRLNLLLKFKDNYIKWWEKVKKDWPNTHETADSKKYREKANFIIDEIDNIVIQAGINPTVFYSPSPTLGGIQGNINIILNAFVIYQYKIPQEAVIDRIDQSIGRYTSNIKPSIIRNINPFYWISEFAYFLFSIPLSIIASALRVSTDKLEKNAFVKTLEMIWNLILNIGFILGVLSSLKTIFPSIDFQIWFDHFLK